MEARRSESFPPQEQQRQPGRTADMQPKPREEGEQYQPAGKLRGKVALITGGDSGVGRAVAIAFAKEGADVAILYLEETEDARQTEVRVEQEGRRCLTLAGDVGDEEFCRMAVEETVRDLGKLDILVNNAAEQHEHQSVEEIDAEELDRVFRTNVYSMFYLVKAALPHLKKGATVINTTSVTAYHGNPKLLDYSATKGAIVAFTRSLALQLADRGIRVNGVAPGPIWTPLIPASFSGEHVEEFGKDTPMGRAGQPEEVAPSYVFLACNDSSYMTGQILHPNGGEIVNG